MLNIWQTYFIRLFFSVFFLFLLCFYSLYVLIDYANHTNTLIEYTWQNIWQNIIVYYSYVFSTRAELLVPLALLIASIYTVTTVNIHHELVALLSSGISLPRLMRPFLCIGLLATIALYLNEQFLLPDTLYKLRQIESKNKSQKRRSNSPNAVQAIVLEDQSRLLFQDYQSSSRIFYAVYWIESMDSVYRMKTLTYTPIPVGQFVDHLVRQPNGELLQENSYETLPLEGIKFNVNFLQSALLEPEMYSLTTLFQQYLYPSVRLNEKESKIVTAFYWKLCSPWLCLLAVLIPIPFCVQFSRQFPIFFIYVCCLFGLIALYLLMDAAQVIAKKQVISPIWAIGLPFGSILGYFTWRYHQFIN